MKNLTYLVFGLIILVFIQACQDRHGKNFNKTARVNQDELVFIKSGIEGGLTEIKASGLAITNSNNQRVIGLAKMMIEDHTKSGDGLKKIEHNKQVEEIDTISGDHQKEINELSKKSGGSFDKAYINMMVADHMDAVKLFTNASESTDTEISKFAAETLPALKMHLDSANAILATFK
jgi:putative membrane protein